MRLAIIIPAYNCAKTLLATINSLNNIQHGWDSVESLIICDDASTDETPLLIRSLSFNKTTLISIKNNNNIGEAGCYRKMLKKVSPEVEWLIILHADDLALKNFLTQNIALAKSASAKTAAISSNFYVFGNGKEVLASAPEDNRIVKRGGSRGDIEFTALYGTWWHISGSLVRRSAWERVGGRDGSLPQLGDWDLMFKWQGAGLELWCCQIATTMYRESPQSVSSRSYLSFSDVKERAEVLVKNKSVIANRTIYRYWAKAIIFTTFRRSAKFFLHGKMAIAFKGLKVGFASFMRVSNLIIEH